MLRQGSHGSSGMRGPLNANFNTYWIKNNIHFSKLMIRSFDKGNFRFLVAASVNVYLWIWVEAFQQERINDPHYPPPSPQCQGALLGSGALSYISDLVFVLPTGQYSFGVRAGKGTTGSSLKFMLYEFKSEFTSKFLGQTNYSATKAIIHLHLYHCFESRRLTELSTRM